MYTLDDSNNTIYKKETDLNGEIIAAVSYYRTLNIFKTDSLVTIELRKPDLDDPKWDGSLVSESAEVKVFVDGIEALNLNLVNGTGQFEFSPVDPGTYTIRAESVGVGSVELQVTV